MAATFTPTRPTQSRDLLAIGSDVELAMELEELLGSSIALWDGATGECRYASPDQPNATQDWRGPLVKAVAERGTVEVIAEEDPIVVMAIPLTINEQETIVATGTFVTRALAATNNLHGAANLLQLDLPAAQAWLESQPVWDLVALEHLATATMRRFASEARTRRALWEVERISENLTATYEEICLLHEMTNNLRLSATDEQLGRLALDRLLACLPAQGVMLQLLPVADPSSVTYKARVQTQMLTAGDCPLDTAGLARLIAHLDLNAGCGPFVGNLDITQQSDWPFDNVRQLIVVPLAESDKLFGWLAVFNHVDGLEFGTIEASLLNSVGVILGVHCGNRDLYRLQDEFLASVVRAMTSAIDAKDPYTCGHSDRVARIAVRLAKQLGFSTEEMANIYMAGLLHDVGKIGVDDQILRKHGKLTTEEFDHIKQHPELGCKILADLKPLASVIPAVLHHHEQWDGCGYPSKLVAEEIPFIARVVAVADAFDAMISDRPYRRGMPLERVEEIFVKGSNQQWDKRVVDAYFAAREDIRDITRRERANLSLDVAKWT